MKLLEFLKAKQLPLEEPLPEAQPFCGEPYKRLARRLTRDEALLQELFACFENPTEYYTLHRGELEERSISSEDNRGICWLTLVNRMEDAGLFCELDWKEELSEFIGWMEQLAESRGLPVQPEWFSEEGEIPDWCAVLEEKWRPYGYLVGGVDIDSDSYVLFPCPCGEFEELKALAAEAGHRIVFWGKEL